MATQYRIEDKGNVHRNGKKTSFKIFVMEDGDDCYTHQGNYFARGWDSSDQQCVSCYHAETTDEEIEW